MVLFLPHIISTLGFSFGSIKGEGIFDLSARDVELASTSIGIATVFSTNMPLLVAQLVFYRLGFLPDQSFLLAYVGNLFSTAMGLYSLGSRLASNSFYLIFPSRPSSRLRLLSQIIVFQNIMIGVFACVSIVNTLNSGRFVDNAVDNGKDMTPFLVTWPLFYVFGVIYFYSVSLSEVAPE